MAVMTVCKAESWTTSSVKIDDSMVISKFTLEVLVDTLASQGDILVKQIQILVTPATQDLD